MARKTRTLTLFAALLALILALWAPAALAHHKDGHDGGPSTSESKSETRSDRDGDADNDPETHTEDNDNDGVDNDDDTTESSHPSGKDRYEESGESGNQGRSESNPDDTNGPRRFEGEEGSPDKPNGAGGEDIYDQDGNNGCGNDQDFDDDNNGWCGKPDEPNEDTTEVEVEGEIIQKPCDADATMPGLQKCEKPDEVEVQGIDLEKQPSSPDRVLGVRLSAAPAVAPAAVAAAPEARGAALPFTGASDLVPFAAIALLLIAIGTLSLRARRDEA